MGCDGGTIPKRHEVVKSKQQAESRDKDNELSAKWQFCALSGMKLKPPIVACQLGRLFNKDTIIEHILELKAVKLNNTRPSTSASNSSTQLRSQQNSLLKHIKSMKDVKELKIKTKDEVGQQATSTSKISSQFYCPITNLEMNGRYKFCYFLTCGCVVSERALKQIPNKGRCLLCSKFYDLQFDVIILNGDADEIRELKEKLIKRRERALEDRKSKHRIDEDPTSKSLSNRKKLRS